MLSCTLAVTSCIVYVYKHYAQRSLLHNYVYIFTVVQVHRPSPTSITSNFKLGGDLRNEAKTTDVQIYIKETISELTRKHLN